MMVRVTFILLLILNLFQNGQLRPGAAQDQNLQRDAQLQRFAAGRGARVETIS